MSLTDLYLDKPISWRASEKVCSGALCPYISSSSEFILWRNVILWVWDGATKPMRGGGNQKNLKFHGFPKWKWRRTSRKKKVNNLITISNSCKPLFQDMANDSGMFLVPQSSNLQDPWECLGDWWKRKTVLLKGRFGISGWSLACPSRGTTSLSALSL